MKGARILIDRLNVDLFGISADAGNAFGEELGRELEGRLRTASLEPNESQRISSVALGRLDAPDGDPGSLAEAVAARLIRALRESQAEPERRSR